MRAAAVALVLIAASVAAEDPSDAAGAALQACGGTRIVLTAQGADAAQRALAAEVLNRRLDRILPRDPGRADRFAYAVDTAEGTLEVRLPASTVAAAAFEGILVRGEFGFHDILTVADGGVALPVAGRPAEVLAVDPAPLLTTADLAEVAPVQDAAGAPAVSFRLTEAGAGRLAGITAARVGRPLAIVYDGTVLAAPRIMAPIEGGAGLISGDFSFDEALELAVILDSGTLPVDLVVERVEQVAGDPEADQSVCPRLPQ